MSHLFAKLGLFPLEQQRGYVEDQNITPKFMSLNNEQTLNEVQECKICHVKRRALVGALIKKGKER
jgi:hypothetical protein